MRKLLRIPVGLLFLLVIPLLGQTFDRYTIARRNKLYADARKAELSIRLDRQTYFPSERMEITVGVRNTSDRRIEIPQPFHLSGACIELFTWNPNRPEYGDTEGFVAAAEDPLTDRLAIRFKVPPTIKLARGQELTRTFLSTETFPGDQSPLVDYGAAREPGRYRLRYTVIGDARVEFAVVPAVLEAVALVTPPGALLAALGGDNAHWIVIDSAAAGQARLRYLRIGEPLSQSSTLIRHVRLARSALPITSISGVSDPDDSITITWTDSSGKSGSIRVDKDWRVLSAQQ